MYPRHFGVTFKHRADFDALYDLCRQRGAPFFADVSLRFEGRVEVHRASSSATRRRTYWSSSTTPTPE